VLHAEGARRRGETRDPPVEHVAHLREQDQDRRDPVLMIERGDDRVEPGEETERGDQIREEIDPAAQRRNTAARATLDDAQARTAHAGILATALAPACTRAPRATSGSTSGGR